MGIETGQYEFMLSRPISYSFDGTTHETKTIVLQEPGMEHHKYCEDLNQMITRSELEAMKTFGSIKDDIGEIVKPLQEQLEKVESGAESAYQIIKVALSTSETIKMSKFVGLFEKMACIPRPKKAICLVDGRAIMTQAIYDTLYPHDATEMALRWCAFFGTPSEGGGKKESEQQPGSATEPMEA